MVYRKDVVLIVHASAGVVKLVDTHVSGTCEATRGGSSPLLGTIF